MLLFSTLPISTLPSFHGILIYTHHFSSKKKIIKIPAISKHMCNRFQFLQFSETIVPGFYTFQTATFQDTFQET